MILSVIIAMEISVRMVKKCFEIEVSKATPQYLFRKGLKLFVDKSYQTSKDKLKKNILGREYIDMLST